MERSRKKQRVLIGLAFAVGMGVASAPVEAKITANQTPEYIQECESEGVPIPDVVDINGGNGWVKKGALSPDRVAQTGSFGPAEVHYWSIPMRACASRCPERSKAIDPSSPLLA